MNGPTVWCYPTKVHSVKLLGGVLLVAGLAGVRLLLPELTLTDWRLERPSSAAAVLPAGTRPTLDPNYQISIQSGSRTAGHRDTHHTGPDTNHSHLTSVSTSDLVFRKALRL